MPTDGSLRWGLSVVALLDGQCAEELAAVGAGSAEALTPDDIVHTASSLHVTLRTLEPHRVAVGADDALLAEYRTVLDAVAAASRSFAIDFRGVILGPGGVLVAGYPCGDELAAVRVALHDRLAERSLAGPPEHDVRRTTAHVSLVAFMGSEVDTERLLTWHAAHRHTSFPRHRVDRLAIVQYRFRPSFEMVVHHEAMLPSPG